jgi:hypothetical protein
MTIIWTLESDAGYVQPASLKLVLGCLESLARGQSPGGLSLTDGEERALLVASYECHATMGYHLFVREADEVSERVLVEPAWGHQMVRGVIGGQMDFRPRFVFVSDGTARHATETFFHTGRRDPSFLWLPFSETKGNT